MNMFTNFRKVTSVTFSGVYQYAFCIILLVHWSMLIIVLKVFINILNQACMRSTIVPVFLVRILFVVLDNGTD